METPLRYACVLIDEIFKLTIANKEHEDLLRMIVELLIPGKKIRKLTFNDKENHGLALSDKNVTFDLYCTEEGTGEQFSVEMQVVHHDSYADRMLCYATYPIHQQLALKLKENKKKGKRKRDKMDYKLHPLYVVSIVNFSIEHPDLNALEDGLISRYEIRNGPTGELMTDALHFVYLELGRLRWGQSEDDRCETLLEQFAHGVKYMHTQSDIPESFSDPLLQKLYAAAELANLSIAERAKIDRHMTTQLDINGAINYAERKGREKGRAEGRAETARANAKSLRDLGVDVSILAKGTGLSEEEIRAL